MDLSLVATGALTGFLVGLTGVGGGALTTPILLLVFGIAPVSAIGTDLWYAGITKIVASVRLNKAGMVDWQVARRLWLGSLPAAVICLIFIGQVHTSTWIVQAIQTLVGVLVVLTSISLLVQSRLQLVGRQRRLTEVESFKAAQAPLTVLAGAVLGALVTLTSIGAGALGAVVLTYLYPLRLTPPRLVATDIVHAVPLTIAAGLGYIYIGEVDFHLLANMLTGSIPAVLLGVTCSRRIPYHWLKLVIALILLTVGLKMLSSLL